MKFTVCEAVDPNNIYVRAPGFGTFMGYRIGFLWRVEGVLAKSSEVSTSLTGPHFTTAWHGLGLLQRYLSSCALIFIVGLAILGVWTVSRLQQAVETEVGHRAATVLDFMLQEHAEDLATEVLSPELGRIIDAHFQEISASLGIVEMKIWSARGTVLYASRPEMTGSVFPVSADLANAFSGEVTVNVGDIFHADTNRPDATTGPRLFEIYVPIRIRSLNQIVAVAEYYQNAAVASEALTRAWWQTWMLIAVVGLLFVAVLFLVLRHSDAVIMGQRAALGSRMADLAQLLKRNHETQILIQKEARRRQEEHDVQLRQINADIHDGIGQLLTVALLRMKPVLLPGTPQEDNAHAVRLILEEAMSEVQALLTKTSLPQLYELPLGLAVTTIIDDHIRRTATHVSVFFNADLPEPALPVKVAICRLVQEGLHNAFKHAGGQDQQVRLQAKDGHLVVSVHNGTSDPRGPQQPRPRQPMGLRNLRYRVERLRGTVQIFNSSDAGMEIRATFPIQDPGDDHG